MVCFTGSVSSKLSVSFSKRCFLTSELSIYHFSGKILDALELPVHAESWLRHGCKLDKKDRDMSVLFQNIRVKRLYGPLTQGTKVKDLLLNIAVVDFVKLIW